MKIDLEVEGDVIVRASVASGSLRELESVLRGRPPMDAVVITCRVCGHCGAAHSTASTAALAAVYGTRSPPNGVLCRNVILATELLLDHLDHFYLSCMARLAESPGAGSPSRFAALGGESLRRFLRARTHCLALLGIFAGKWPNTLALQPGGTTKVIGEADVLRALGVLAEFTEFLRESTYGGDLDEWLSIAKTSELDAWLDGERGGKSDAGAYLALARSTGLDRLGAGPGRFLSSGAFPSADGGEPALRAGTFDGEPHEFDAAAVEDTVLRFRTAKEEEAAYASNGHDRSPNGSPPSAAAEPPRYLGFPVEVGPQARLVVHGDPLARDLVRDPGPSACSRVMLRLREAAFLARRLARWIEAIRPREPFYAKEASRDGVACGFAPSPRGMLVHRVEIRDGAVAGYRILTPTEWNFSSRDASGRPGAVEEALVGAPAGEGGPDPRTAHVIQSFNPCAFCLVH